MSRLQLPRPAVARRCALVLGGFALVLGFAALAAAGGSLAAGSKQKPTTPWKLQPTPNPGNADISYLSSVACPSRQLCIAVGGSSMSISSSERTLAERWDGKHWRIQSIPTPRGTSDSLFAVSCVSSSACTAVGGAFQIAGRRQTTLTEAWDGTSWRVQSAPRINAPSALYGVSCTSASSCVAVGHTVATPERAIIESWDGKVWRSEAIPPQARDTDLSGVSCSSPRACTAVGWNSAAGSARPRALGWDGKRWRLQTVPVPGNAMGLFDAVSCTSPRACMATGTDTETTHPGGPTLAERWNGRTWHAEPTPNPPDFSASLAQVTLHGVSCTSATACTALGEYDPDNRTEYFIEVWNGRRWRMQPVPHPGDFRHGALMGISCVSGGCTAVGAYTGNVRLQVTLGMAR